MDHPIKKPSPTTYKNKMIPHLLPKEAKRIGITPADKESWKKLVKYVRTKVEKRYKTASAKELGHDMEFNKGKSRTVASRQLLILKDRKTGYKTADADIIEGYLQNEEILNNIHHITKSTREWISDRRTEKLGRLTKYEREFAIIMGRNGINVLMKMPFVADTRIYFSDVYIPSYRLAIEIDPVSATIDQVRDSLKTADLNSIGVKRIRLFNYEACNPNIALHIIQKYGRQ